MADALVDSDVLIDHLRGARELRPGGRSIWYSTITRCELFAGRNAREDVVRDLLGRFSELSVDRQTAEVGGTLRRRLGLPMADALIAATALIHDLDLVSRNQRHFERVPALRLRPAL